MLASIITGVLLTGILADPFQPMPAVNLLEREALDIQVSISIETEVEEQGQETATGYEVVIEAPQETPEELIPEEGIQETPSEAQELQPEENCIEEESSYVKVLEYIPAETFDGMQEIIDSGEIAGFGYGAKYIVGHPDALQVEIGNQYSVDDSVYTVTDSCEVYPGDDLTAVSFVEGYDLFDMVYTESFDCLILQASQGESTFVYYAGKE